MQAMERYLHGEADDWQDYAPSLEFLNQTVSAVNEYVWLMFVCLNIASLRHR